ncbi:probable serine/threonine-protein kinase DDB_G0267514 [Montipora foliosa]|uniref:probable serine/threonine-protein kinase DDB_G0267514 n=1 Tax=Montipora foliosa TaxID=591990 RepID=UPI0035F1523C
MNEEERRIHKERRKRQKRRRKERKREEKREANLADRRKRVEKEAARIVEEQGHEARGTRKRAGVHQDKGVPKKVPCQSLGSVKEINPFQVTVDGKHLGSGTYGSCYIGSYRGLDVVVKQLKIKKYRGETQEDAERRVRNELIYEARIINKLGDHPGLPLLFGVAEALIHVHNAGFAHNDIKGNNVVLDKASKGKYNPLLIDFGKSLPLTGLKGPKVLSTEQQKRYREEYPHIAPEIVTGKRGQSFASDTFSFAYMAELIFMKAKLGPLPDVIKGALDSDPDRRPTLTKIHALL